MEKDFLSVDNVKAWLHFLKKENSYTCARLMPFGMGCDNCAAYCRMVGNNGVENCVLRGMRGLL